MGRLFMLGNIFELNFIFLALGLYEFMKFLTKTKLINVCYRLFFVNERHHY